VVEPLFLIAVTVIALLVLTIYWIISRRNRFVAMSNLVAESWRQVDVELRRRYDLIPNLVRVVEGYAQYERATLEALTAARSAVTSAHALPQRAMAEDGLGQTVRMALVQAEAYPVLQANQQFLALQHELVETEDRIAAGRRLYNGNVRAYNTALQTFPSSLIGSMMQLQPAEYFQGQGR